jgi:hypothetical protein
MKIVKGIGFCALLIAMPFVAQAFHWPKVAIAIVPLYVLVFWLSLEVSKLTEASQKTVRDNYAKIVKQIEQGKPVEPKHNPPTTFSRDDDKERMFRDFASFANRVNQKLQWGGWRLQEEPRGEGTRNYTILYNGLEVGRLKLDTWGLKYATADSEISATVELNYLQRFTHSTVYHFLDCLAYFLGSDTRANFDRQKAHIDHDLAAHLWNVVRVPGTLQPFSMHITGRPLACFDRGEVAEDDRRFWEGLREKIDTAKTRGSARGG